MSVSSGFDESIITPIDPEDTVALQTFEQVNTALVAIGSATRMRVSRSTEGGMSATLTKNYMLTNLDDPTKQPNISITAVEELRVRGHVTLFGTGDATEVTLTVAGKVHRHQFKGDQAYVVSPIDGAATALTRHRKLWYLSDFDAKTPQDLTEKSEIMADLSAIYNVATVEVRLASYNHALALAIGRRQGVHATRALQDRPPTFLFPPNVALHDHQHSSTGYIDPITKLTDDLYGLQVLAAMHHDEHEEERAQLIQQMRQTVEELADITPNVASICSINDYTSVYQGSSHVDFTGEALTNSTGPPPAVEAADPLPEVNPYLR